MTGTDETTDKLKALAEPQASNPIKGAQKLPPKIEGRAMVSRFQTIAN